MSPAEAPAASAAKTLPLTGWSKFRICAGGFFCLIGGLVLARSLSDLLALVTGVFGVAVISFGISYAANRKNWNGFSKWFFWTALILGIIAGRAL